MPVYNGEEFLKDAIESVLRQTLTAIEVIVVDDCSSDKSLEIANGLADDRFTILRNETNRGQTASLNAGFPCARGKFVSCLDADDLYLPRKLSRQLAFMESHQEYALCGTGALFINTSGGLLKRYRPKTHPLDILYRLCHATPLIHISVMMRREILNSLGGYDIAFRYAQDYDLWSRFARAGWQIGNLVEPLVKVRCYPSSSNASNMYGRVASECTGIIQKNVKHFCDVALSDRACRNIYYLTLPLAPTGISDMISAYENLTQIVASIYRAWRRLTAQLLLRCRLVWAISKYFKRTSDWRKAVDSIRVEFSLNRAHFYLCYVPAGFILSTLRRGKLDTGSQPASRRRAPMNFWTKISGKDV
jgi:glycosyltransferase involved in cell wall biosynthesis